MTKFSLFFGTTLVAAAAISMAAGARHSLVTVGSAAPSFEATDSNGKRVKLGDYKGKYVVLEWSNFDCPYVKKHYNGHNMQDLQKTYTEKGVVWLTVFSSPEGMMGYYPPAKLNEMA